MTSFHDVNSPEAEIRNIVVEVNSSKESDTAFRLALLEPKSGDKLYIVFVRPLRTGSAHYEFATKAIRQTFDKMALELLNKYATWAADAKVTFETAEVEGAHAAEALALKCREVSASLLIHPASSSKLQRLLRGELGHPGADYCEACNPFLRGHGRIVRSSACNLGRGQVASPGCRVVKVPLSGMVAPAVRMARIGTNQEGYRLVSRAA